MLPVNAPAPLSFEGSDVAYIDASQLVLVHAGEGASIEVAS